MTGDIKLTHHPGFGWAYHFDGLTGPIYSDGHFLTKWGARRAAKQRQRALGMGRKTNTKGTTR